MCTSHNTKLSDNVLLISNFVVESLHSRLIKSWSLIAQLQKLRPQQFSVCAQTKGATKNDRISVTMVSGAELISTNLHILWSYIEKQR